MVISSYTLSSRDLCDLETQVPGAVGPKRTAQGFH